MHDWEGDPRPYNECLRAWREAHDWSWQQVADELREPLATVKLHSNGRYPKDTRSRRRMMTLIDSIEPGGDT